MAWTASAHSWIASTTALWPARTVFRISPWSSWPTVLVSLIVPPRCLLQTKVRKFAALVKRSLDISSTPPDPTARPIQQLASQVAGRRSRQPQPEHQVQTSISEDSPDAAGTARALSRPRFQGRPGSCPDAVLSRVRATARLTFYAHQKASTKHIAPRRVRYGRVFLTPHSRRLRTAPRPSARPLCPVL